MGHFLQPKAMLGASHSPSDTSLCGDAHWMLTKPERPLIIPRLLRHSVKACVPENVTVSVID